MLEFTIFLMKVLRVESKTLSFHLTLAEKSTLLEYQDLCEEFLQLEASTQKSRRSSFDKDINTSITSLDLALTPKSRRKKIPKAGSVKPANILWWLSKHSQLLKTSLLQFLEKKAQSRASRIFQNLLAFFQNSWEAPTAVIHTDFDLTNHLNPRSFGDAFYWFTRDPNGSLPYGFSRKKMPLLHLLSKTKRCAERAVQKSRRDFVSHSFKIFQPSPPYVSREHSKSVRPREAQSAAQSRAVFLESLTFQKIQYFLGLLLFGNHYNKKLKTIKISFMLGLIASLLHPL